MKNRLRYWLVVGLAAATAAACSKIDPITAPAPSGGSANFGVYVALGTSLASGYSSGGLVNRHQVRSYPYLFARQVGAPFTIPSISDSGIPQLLVLRSLSPLVITRAGTLGAPTNLAQPTSYHDLGIPGALLVDALDSTLYGRSALFPIIQRGRGTLLQQALGLAPTFISFEYGVNEVLSAATAGSGTLANPAFQPPSFAGMYTTAMNLIAAGAPGAKVALFNVPGVTSIPFFTTFSPFTLDGAGQPTLLVGLAPGDLVLLTAGDSLARGTGFPLGAYNYVNPSVPGNGRPLAGFQVLDVAEKTSLQSVIDAYNVIIDSVATGRGHALVDLNALLETASTDGIEVQGTAYTSDFITGGVFSLDGVHPTDLGYGFMANSMIAAVNGKFGASIQLADLNQAATIGGYRLQPAAERSKLKPWVRDLRAVFDDLYGWRGTMLP